MKRLMTLAVLAGLLLVGSASAASIVIEEYTDYSAWLADVGSVATEDFGGALPNVAAVVGLNAHGSVSSGAWLDTLAGSDTTTFSYTGGNFTAVGGFFDLNPNNFGSGVVISGNFAGGPETFETLIFPGFTSGFYGLRVNTALTSITLSTTAGSPGQQEVYSLDDLSFGASAPPPPPGIPEPATLGLFGVGLVGMGVLRRFRSR